MKVLVTTHPGCLVTEQILRRAVRFLAQHRNQVTIVLLESDKWDKNLRVLAKTYHLPVLTMKELRKEQSRFESFLDWCFRTSDLKLALRLCDEVLFFWDGQIDTRARLTRARKTEKTVTVARTDGKYPIVPVGVG